MLTVSVILFCFTHTKCVHTGYFEFITEQSSFWSLSYADFLSAGTPLWVLRSVKVHYADYKTLFMKRIFKSDDCTNKFLLLKWNHLVLASWHVFNRNWRSHQNEDRVFPWQKRKRDLVFFESFHAFFFFIGMCLNTLPTIPHEIEDASQFSGCRGW